MADEDTQKPQDPQQPEPEADGYYGDEDVNPGDLDLRFLDDEDADEAGAKKDAPDER
jgi:hypothetical protein